MSKGRQAMNFHNIIVQVILCWGLAAYILTYAFKQRQKGRKKVFVWYLVVGIILVFGGVEALYQTLH